MKSLFIFAGEASGDLHGGNLIRSIQKEEPHIHLYGVGGPRMRKETFTTFLPMEEFQVMGLSDVLFSLPRLWKLFHKIRSYILQQNPDGVLLIDYPGFNLRLAKSLRKSGYQGQLIQYICPTVWAHGKERVDLLSNHYDLLLTIYPFEANYFPLTRLKVEYIGNPLLETIATHTYQENWLSKINIPRNSEIVALFPGSRLGEIKRHTPQQLQIATELKKRHPSLHFALSCGHDSLKDSLLEMIDKFPLHLGKDISLIPADEHYDLMKNSRLALAKSGTVTLELALHKVPTVVHYELSTLNYLFAKYLLKLNLSHYCIVNILGRETIFPEFIGKNLSLNLIEGMLEKMLNTPGYCQEIKEKCSQIKESFGDRPSNQSAAKAILEQIEC